jgi:hypothetical protein
MMRNGILEESCSAYVNALTLAGREEKPILICVDKRKLKKLEVPDSVKVQPMYYKPQDCSTSVALATGPNDDNDSGPPRGHAAPISAAQNVLLIRD